ncbi:MAB_1171c family putative transporter [Kitasatospora purpeofusca]|uniref:MAB_1171c family putative transporter n=1 Tax=Kitasatospora purpeofusca TaxID=67352 RepID=UPI0036B75BFC
MNPGKIAVLAMLWTVTFWRLPSAIRVPKQRALWVGFAALAVVSTIGIPTVSHAIDHAAGITNLAILLKHLIGIIDCGAALEFVITMARPDLVARIRKPHIILAVTAAVSLSVLFVRIQMPTEVDDFYEAYAGSWSATTYAAVFIGYLGVVMTVATWLFWSASRNAGAAFLRTGLRVLAVGTAVGVLYTALRMIQMFAQLVDVDLIDANLINNVEWVAMALILIGNSIPAGGVAARAIRNRRHLRQISPLWSALTGQVPEIVLAPTKRQSQRLRLHRLVIEIRDASLALTSYADDHVRAQARQAAQDQGLHGDALDAMVEALTLRAAHAARSAGKPPVAISDQAEGTPPEGIDFDAEIVRLHHLNEAYHSPAAAAFVRACA